MGNVLILSPHLDDAALSCGGFMSQAVANGEPMQVYTLFCAPYQGPLSPSARELHASWGNPPDICTLRLQEDREALAVLGAQGLYGEVRDLIYRQDEQGKWLYEQMQAIQGQRHPQDNELVNYYMEDIMDQWPREGWKVFAPLGIGAHIDHQIAFEIGMGLVKEGYEVAFYEDLPYALREDWLQARLADCEDLRPEVRLFSLESLNRKILALRCYASQIPQLFGGEDTMEEWLKGQAYKMSQEEALGGEKVWRSPNLK